MMYINLEKLLATSWALQGGQQPLEARCLAISIMLAVTFVVFGAFTKIVALMTGLGSIVLNQDRRSRLVLLVVTVAITPFVWTLLFPGLSLSPALWLFALLEGVGIFMILEVLLPPYTPGR